ncbi:AraC family transcriptional regulator [Roseinatronobacter sp. HJB301]|uniref:AraC family transcriptional regulator n=1 Tax=Roseinatronobacter alkalisoli TaxID=3028235 RepID=A0ABT5TER4_9RHOB|nr:AraC family transcriptional regulator [Roseinatronobacter sp. HJB301]MDD7973618.1 AraC family transcriptional regulator [Roseinatronobacter sp. HJB301]
MTGPTTAYYDVAVEPGMGFAGIRLRPGFFQCILGFKPISLREQTLVDDVAISACPPLATLCAETDTPEALHDRLIGFVRSRVGQDHAPLSRQTRRILSAFHASSGRLPVQDIARMHGLSARTVQRIVLDATGLPPKSYARILQFHRAMRLLRDHRLSPSEAAVEAGYADQAHMTHALRRFGGLSPARLADATLVTLRD